MRRAVTEVKKREIGENPGAWEANSIAVKQQKQKEQTVKKTDEEVRAIVQRIKERHGAAQQQVAPQELRTFDPVPPLQAPSGSQSLTPREPAPAPLHDAEGGTSAEAAKAARRKRRERQQYADDFDLPTPPTTDPAALAAYDAEHAEHQRAAWKGRS